MNSLKQYLRQCLADALNHWDALWREFTSYPNNKYDELKRELDKAWEAVRQAREEYAPYRRKE